VLEADGLTDQGCRFVCHGVQGDGEVAQIGGRIQRDVVASQRDSASDVGGDARQVVGARAQLGDVDHPCGGRAIGANDVQIVGLCSGQRQGSAIGQYDVLHLADGQVHARQVGGCIDVQGGVGTQHDVEHAVGVG